MRDQKTSNREAELTATPRIGSGDLLARQVWTSNLAKLPVGSPRANESA